MPTDPGALTFYARHVTALRREHGWTKAQLARLVRVSRDTIDRLEANGARAPRLALLEDLANAFGCRVRDFFDPKPPARRPLRKERGRR
jgi:DNA-binding XRE family transcriptional regulator